MSADSARAKEDADPTHAGALGDGDEASATAPRYYDWRRVCPELEVFLDSYDDLAAEMRAATNWKDWPETNLYGITEGYEWKVFPFCYTFPAWDATKTAWVAANCEQCPKTTALLRSLPNVRTALYSRMSAGTRLTAHSGWAELANHVLRAHIPLALPEADRSGVEVEGERRMHVEGDILVFDDSKLHLGFNEGATHRCVLIVDFARPADIPLGRASGGKTEALEQFIAYFASGGAHGGGA